MQIFCDMDGVLADMHGHYLATFGEPFTLGSAPEGWACKVASIKTWWADIPPMPDAMELWEHIAPHNPIIITGTPRTGYLQAVAHKRAWASKYIGDDVPVICCPSAAKSDYAKFGDVIIDDWVKYRHLWEAKGGRWILHTSAQQSIRELEEMGI